MKKIFAVLPNYELTELDIHPVNFNFQKNIRSFVKFHELEKFLKPV